MDSVNWVDPLLFPLGGGNDAEGRRNEGTLLGKETRKMLWTIDYLTVDYFFDPNP